jgi:IclR family pca regulon transcriptional regulator
VRRFLLTLVELGFVGTDGKMFWLLPPILRLGYAYISSQSWLELAAPHVHRVAQTLSESCSASVLDGPEIVYVLRAASTRLLAFNVPVGRRLPAFCTSMGRVLLSGLSDNELREFLATHPRPAYTPSTLTDVPTLLKTVQSVRNQQFAYIDQQFEPGLRSISVPIFDRGKVLAALNVASHAARTKKSDFTQKFLPVLRQAADAISRDIDMQSSLTRTPSGAPLV